jgi:hypothetical protein
MHLFLKFFIEKKRMYIIRAIFMSERTDKHSNFDPGFTVTVPDAHITHILPSFTDASHFQEYVGISLMNSHVSTLSAVS